jgi:uncharacterized protein (DUF849 family)
MGCMTSDVTRMKVCLNGERIPAEHPRVPLTPGELARAAESSVAAGAQAIHLHPRDRDGSESLAAQDVGAAVGAVRAACPGVGVGVTTGLWITGGDPHARAVAVQGWAGLDDDSRPDFASVNVSEAGWAELSAALHVAGIATEAGVWSVADTRALATFRPANPVLRILVEVGGPAATAAGRADEILLELDRTGAVEPRLLHGDQDTCWPLVAHAGALGLVSRIGLEDTITGPYGEAVSGNADLVRMGLSTWRSAAPARRQAPGAGLSDA